MKKLVLLFSILSLGLLSYGQDGEVEIIGSSRIDMLLEDKLAGVDTTEMWGYRIQIYFGNNRKSASELAQKFRLKYPEWSEEVYEDYFQPSWRVRVGNFYRKIDAQHMMHILQKEFGDVFLVRDKIELPVLRSE